jgi:hypothetical protein
MAGIASTETEKVPFCNRSLCTQFELPIKCKTISKIAIKPILTLQLWLRAQTKTGGKFPAGY